MAGERSTAVIRKLLENGANPNLLDSNGHTCLHAAVYHSDNVEIVRLQLDHGADSQAVTQEGKKPQQIAEQRGRHEVAALLNGYVIPDPSTPQAGEREIVIVRELRASRELVFDAWTNAEQLAKWWGPQGFTTTFKTFEPRPGGTWTFTMHSPDGVDFPNTNIFVEVDRPKRIVFKHDVFPHFLATASFEELDHGRTRLTYRTVFDETDAVFEKVKIYAAPGAEQTLDRLEELLAA